MIRTLCRPTVFACGWTSRCLASLCYCQACAGCSASHFQWDASFPQVSMCCGCSIQPVHWLSAQNMLDGTMNLTSTESLRAQEPELKPLKVRLFLFLFNFSSKFLSDLICFSISMDKKQQKNDVKAFHCSPDRIGDSAPEWKHFITLDYHCHEIPSFLSGYIVMYSSAGSEASFTAQVFLCPCVVQKCFSVGRANW